MPPSSRPHSGQPPAPESAEAAAARAAEVKTASALLHKAAERLEEIVEQETAALRSRKAVDFNDCNNRKSQGLLELSRALHMLRDGVPSDETKDALRRLRGKLDANRGVLQTHLDAVHEVAGIIADAIRNADSDGTYSLRFRSKSDDT
jgi:hypothetical protein